MIDPIGVIHSPYKERSEAPRQGRHSDDEIVLEVFGQFSDALLDIESYTHLIVLYWGDRADRGVLQAIPPGRLEATGVFACRSPNRPNPVAFCVAELISREGGRLFVRGVDALDGSPLIDLKPYVAALDSIPAASRREVAR